MPETHVMLFDLYAGGHHGQHVRQLVAYWGENALPGRLDVVVPPSFLDVHTDVQRLAEHYAAAGVRLIPIDQAVQLRSKGPLRLVRNDLQHGRLLRRYVKKLQPDHCMLMYFDHVQLSLATDLRFDVPVRLSGTYFRPSFHYADLSNAPVSLTERLKGLRKIALLKAALRNPHFATLFCLDPFVVPYIERWRTPTQAVVLPDGIEPAPAVTTTEPMRAQLQVEPGRKMLLLFGSLARRKGVFELFDALHVLPDDVCAQACLVLAGAVVEEDRNALYREVEALRKQKPIQIILRDTFIPAEEIHHLVDAADVMLLPYQRHIGSSGVLVRAAAAQVPVLGSDYGVLGAQIRTRRLGLAVDTTDPPALADGLATFLAQPTATLYDTEEAARFAAENTAERFAATIFEHTRAVPPGTSR